MQADTSAQHIGAPVLRHRTKARERLFLTLAATLVPLSSAKAFQPQTTLNATTPRPPCEHSYNAFRCVVYLKNYDGDTITVVIPSVHPLLGQDITVRVRGIDTPELRGKLPCEAEAARLAQSFVSEELRTAKKIDLINIGRDKYFRILADVLYDGRSLAEQLMRLGLGRPYDGGTKSGRDWCDVRTSPGGLSPASKE